MRIKRSAACICMLFTLSLLLQSGTALATRQLDFTEEQRALIAKTQQGAPLRMGILPHTFPLAECPPVSEDFIGMNRDMLDLISQRTGLQFAFVRVPLEEMSPQEALFADKMTLVAGTIALESYQKNPRLILSERIADGTAVGISAKDTNVYRLKTGKLALMRSYLAGEMYAKQSFAELEVVLYDSNEAVVAAVSRGEADMAIISRYAGAYELQKPRNQDLQMVASAELALDSVIMGLRSPETEQYIAIINKVLGSLSPTEYNHVQIDFLMRHPYEATIGDFAYQNRYALLLGCLGLGCLIFLLLRLSGSRRERALLSIDSLTGAYTESGFLLAVQRALHKSSGPLYLVDFDLSAFHCYNELHGRAAGDELLRRVVRLLSGALSEGDAICRSYADNFKVLQRVENLTALLVHIRETDAVFARLLGDSFHCHYGVYEIIDHSLPVAQIFGYANQAKKAAKQRGGHNVGIFDEQLHRKNLLEAELLAAFPEALAARAFFAVYQPKYDAKNGQICGAEALARWRLPDGQIRSPADFVELFERNGQIRQLDFYMLEEACALQQRLLAQGYAPIPISVNFSQVHLYGDDFIAKLEELISRFGLPRNLLEIEWTETAMANLDEGVHVVLQQLRSLGYLVAMDDFGRAYSSLNMLSSMPLDTIKLDRGFLLQAAPGSREEGKSQEVISKLISLARSLSLCVVAEGVETREQYEFLRDADCHIIQGYYFNPPLVEEEFVALLPTPRCTSKQK